jgi:hypothetical protein
MGDCVCDLFDRSTGTLPDAQGNVVTWWNTTKHAVAKTSSHGNATALAAGSINMEAMIGLLTLTQWAVKVGAAPVPVTQPAIAAPTSASPVANIQAAVAAEATAVVPQTRSALTPLTTGLAPTAPGAPLPDHFLGPFWMLVTPVGGSASISNSHLFLGVPGGANHDPLIPSNRAVLVAQAIGSEDFDVAIKID